MACPITLADLGPSFEDVDPLVFDLWLEAAEEIVLGPATCQTETQTAWVACCVDPCRAVALLTQHLISMDPGTDGGEKTALSEKVGDVSATYANATSTSGKFGGSPYGTLFAYLLGQFELCSAERRTMPFAVVGTGGCGC